MRWSLAVVALVLVGLFAASLVVGYIVGERYENVRLGRTPAAVLTPGEQAAPTPQMPAPTPAIPAPTPAISAPTPTPSPAMTPAQTPAMSPAQTPAALVPAAPSAPAAEATPAGPLNRVQVGAFARRENAEALAAELRTAGFTPYIVLQDGIYKVRVGAFRDRALADRLAERLRALGYDVTIIQ